MAGAKIVYKGKTIGLEVKTMKINGKLAKVEKIIENDAVIVMPLLEKNTVLLERQYRPALGKYIYELPAGHINSGETARLAAVREMREETGFTPKNLKLMFKAYPSPGSSSMVHNCFLATGLEEDSAKLEKDPDEVITLKKVSISKLLDMIKRNEIRDTKTIAAVLYYASFYGKSGSK